MTMVPKLLVLIMGILNIFGFLFFNYLPTYLVGELRWNMLLVGSLCLILYKMGSDKNGK